MFAFLEEIAMDREFEVQVKFMLTYETEEYFTIIGHRHKQVQD